VREGADQRTAVQSSAGNPPPNDCSGSYTYDFNVRIASGIDPALVFGATVDAQVLGRAIRASLRRTTRA
jgi:hypothetical protein